MKKMFRKINVLLLVCSLFFSNATIVMAEDESKADTEVKVELEYPKGPSVTAGAAILMDADTGAILYEKDAYGVYYPASITKIMTCLLAIENLSLDQKITYTEDVFAQLPWDAALLGVERGEELTVKDCLYGLMLRSGNEVAVALAKEVSGSEEEFAVMMTERAKKAGALNTVFTNASGLYQDTHYTTAYDMAVITKEAIKNGVFCEVWGAESYTMSATNMNEAYDITNRHNMLVSTRSEYYKYAQGGKTGYEDLAKRTLVTHAKKDDMSLICVVLFDETAEAYIDTENILDYGFTNFRKARVIDEENRFGNNGFVGVAESAYITVPNDFLVSNLEYEVIYNEDNSNGNIANIKYSYDGHYLGSTVLAFAKDTEEVDGVVTPVKKPEEPEKENVYINVGYIMAAVVIILVIVLVSVYLVKTKQQRKVKRDRKRLFKEEGRKYKIKKRRRG